MTVSETPTGYADAVADVDDDDAKFLMPHEDTLTMNQFLDVIEDPESRPGIHYIQKQVRRHR